MRAILPYIPGRFPLISVEYGAVGGHVVDASDTPFGTGLFEVLADQVFARPLDLAVADRTTFGQSFTVVHPLRKGRGI